MERGRGRVGVAGKRLDARRQKPQQLPVHSVRLLHHHRVTSVFDDDELRTGDSVCNLAAEAQRLQNIVRGADDERRATDRVQIDAKSEKRFAKIGQARYQSAGIDDTR